MPVLIKAFLHPVSFKHLHHGVLNCLRNLQVLHQPHSILQSLQIHLGLQYPSHSCSTRQGERFQPAIHWQIKLLLYLTSRNYFLQPLSQYLYNYNFTSNPGMFKPSCKKVLKRGKICSTVSFTSTIWQINPPRQRELQNHHYLSASYSRGLSTFHSFCTALFLYLEKWFDSLM